MNENNFELNNATNTITENNCNLANNKKKPKKKKIIKIILVIIAAWVVLNILFIAVGLLIDDSSDSNNTDNSTISSAVQNDDSNWSVVDDSSPIYSSGLHYAYKMQPNEFINIVNSNLNEVMVDNFPEESENFNNFYKENETAYYEHNEGYETYTYASNDGDGIIGFYLDTIDTSIIQARTFVVVSDAISAGKSMEEVYDIAATNCALSLNAFGKISTDEIDSIRVKMIEQINNGSFYFAKDDIIIGFSSNDDLSILEAKMFRFDDEIYKILKEQADSYGYDIVIL